MRSTVASAVAALVGFASTAQAATLTDVSGQVLVNRGNGFQIAQPGLELKPGDLIVANPGASAQIAYPEGCVSPVLPGLIASVAAKAPCAAPTANAPSANATPAASAPAVSAGALPGALVVGGIVVGGGALAYALSNKGSSDSSSGTNSKANTTVTTTAPVPASP